MPKMKSHRSALKRFRLTATGKIQRSKACYGHLRRKKSASRKRRLRAVDLVASYDAGRVRRLISGW